MKVSSMKTVALSVPLDYPFRGARQQQMKRVSTVIAQLKTDDGLEAFGLAFAWNDRRIKSPQLRFCRPPSYQVRAVFFGKKVDMDKIGSYTFDKGQINNLNKGRVG